MLDAKYFVKNESPHLFSCGIMLSTIAMILVCLFQCTIFKIVPKQGPKKGIQNLTIIKSGFSFFICQPTFIQLNGLMELIVALILIPIGAGSVE